MPGLIRRLLPGLMALIFLSFVGAPHTVAQTAAGTSVEQAQREVKIDRRKLLVPQRNADGSIKVTPFLEDPVLWARDEQQRFYGRMSATLKAMIGASSARNPWFANSL